MEQAASTEEVRKNNQLHHKLHAVIHGHQLNTLNRWLQDTGVRIGSERKMRTVVQGVVGTNLASEALPFSFPLKRGGEEMLPAPLSHVSDLSEKMFPLLEQNER